MTKAEVIKLVTVVKAYPQYKNASQEDLNGLVSLWSMAIGEYEYREASAALAAWVKTDTKGFPPVPGQVIDKIHSMRTTEMALPVGEAFALYWNAICDSGYRAQERFDALPEIIQQVAGSPSAMHDLAVSEDTNYDVEKSLFEREYNTQVARIREEAKIPSNIREMISERMPGVLEDHARGK